MGIFECGFLGSREKHVQYRKYCGEVSILSNPPRYRYYRIGIDTFAITGRFTVAKFIKMATICENAIDRYLLSITFPVCHKFVGQ